MAPCTAYSWGAILLLLCVCFNHLPTSRALIYDHLHVQNYEWLLVDGKYGFMFGKDRGPWPYKLGPSYCKLDLTVAVDEKESAPDGTVHVGFTRLTLVNGEDGKLGYLKPDICQYSESSDLNDGVEYIDVVQFDESNPYKAYVNVTFDVKEPMPLCAFVQICHGTDSASYVPPNALLTGNAIWENPYGYLPGTEYAYIPVLFLNFLLFSGFFIFYSILFIRHRETSLPLHLGTMVVLFLYILVALVWYLIYKNSNRTGMPICCPAPGTVMFGVIILVLMQATFRCLILCVCLGYGVVHPKLSKVQTFFVIILTALFIVTGIISYSYKFLSSTMDMKKQGAADMPAFLVDSTFMTWIYVSLISQLDDLREKREIYKLEMYQKLAYTVIVALCSYVTITAIIIVWMVAAPTWLWRWVWILKAAQPAISACLLITACIIWRPSPTSNMLSWSKQLPLNEDDASDGSWGAGGDAGVEELEIEMSRVFAILGEEDKAFDLEADDYNDVHVGAEEDHLEHGETQLTKVSPKKHQESND